MGGHVRKLNGGPVSLLSPLNDARLEVNNAGEKTEQHLTVEKAAITKWEEAHRKVELFTLRLDDVQQHEDGPGSSLKSKPKRRKLNLEDLP